MIGMIVPPLPDKPDWMTEEEYREKVCYPYLQQMEAMQDHYRRTVLPRLVVALVVVILSGGVLIWRLWN